MAVLALVASWLTPTTLFLLLNLMIGTILVASRAGSGYQKHSGSDSYPNPAPLVRAPSLIDRVKSINLNMYKFPTPVTAETHFFGGGFGSDHNPNPLARAPSLLDRVKSINLSSFKFPQYNPENEYLQTSQLADSNDQTRFGRFDYPSQSELGDYFQENNYQRRIESDRQEASDPNLLVRAPSLLERVKSINLSSFYKFEPTTTDTHINRHTDRNSISPTDPATDSKHKRTKSERNKTAAKTSEKMKKSASEKVRTMDQGGRKQEEEEYQETAEAVEMRRPATARIDRSTSFGDGEEGVDAKASDFINKFKNQLKLQRLDSILRYKETIKAMKLPNYP